MVKILGETGPETQCFWERAAACALPKRYARASTGTMTGHDEIPADIQRFIMISVPSVPHLEAMLLMRNERMHAWDKSMLARRLYVSEKVAAALLSELQQIGFLRAHPDNEARFQYEPVSGELASMLDRLAVVYEKNLIGVTALIHEKTARMAHRFADAFKWRKDE